MVLPTASLMYWSREQRLLIESTAALEEWLMHSDVGDDLPCDLALAGDESSHVIHFVCLAVFPRCKVRRTCGCSPHPADPLSPSVFAYDGD